MNKEEELRIKGKLDFYMNQKLKVHITRKDGFFWNGYIIDKPTENVYEFEEDKLGRSFLFVLDVKLVNQYEVKE